MTHSPDLWATALRLCLSLGLVVLLCWGGMYMVRRFLQKTPAGGPGGLLQVLGHQYLGMKRTITMVKIPGAVLVLGVTADRIQLLSRIDDPVQLARFDTAVPQASRGRFADHLSKLTSGRNVDLSAPQDADTQGAKQAGSKITADEGDHA